MNEERLDKRAIEKISGPAWEALRPAFETINDALLSVSESATGELTTIYVKYASPETGQQPFGVLWLRKSNELVLGLSLPETTLGERLVSEPKGCKYAGLTKYLVVNADSPVPDQLGDWSRIAYETRCMDSNV